MAETAVVRIEIGFQGGDVVSMRVPMTDADGLDQALRARDDTVCELRGEDGVFLVVLGRVLYVKRYAREAHVGFGSS